MKQGATLGAAIGVTFGAVAGGFEAFRYKGIPVSQVSLSKPFKLIEELFLHLFCLNASGNEGILHLSRGFLIRCFSLAP